MSVHIESIGAADALIEVCKPGVIIGDDTFDQPAVVIGDGDTALVVTGDADQLELLLVNALNAVRQLPEEG